MFCSNVAAIAAARAAHYQIGGGLGWLAPKPGGGMWGQCGLVAHAPQYSATLCHTHVAPPNMGMWASGGGAY